LTIEQQNSLFLEKGLLNASVQMINANTMPQYMKLERQKLFDSLAQEV
jgi:hypothetical protein